MQTVGFFIEVRICLLFFHLMIQVSSQHMRYFLIGYMGSGKTYWAKQWSAAYGLKCFDLDAEIEQRQGKSINLIFKEEGEDAFRKIEKEVLKTFLHLDNFIMSCGGGTPCFHNNMHRMNEHGVTIYLKSTVDELAHRLATEKETRPLIKDVADDVLHSFIEQRLEQRISCYSQAMYHLPTSNLSNENFQRILKRHAK